MSRVPSYMLVLRTNNNIYFIDREPAKLLKRYWNVDDSNIIELSQGLKTGMSLCCVSPQAEVEFVCQVFKKHEDL